MSEATFGINTRRDKLEEFRPTYILPDRYLVNRKGDVYSIRSRRLISQRLDRYGYPRVNLYEGTKLYTVTVHRLVAKAFVPNPNNLPEVNHIDGDKTNNNADNLEWVTSSQNQKHAFKLGLQVGNKGERNGMAKYTESDVRLVCEMLADGKRNKEIRDETGFSRSFIEKIKYGETWTHITKEYGIIPKVERATTSREAYSASDGRGKRRAS